MSCLLFGKVLGFVEKHNKPCNGIFGELGDLGFGFGLY
jgi:hypothetical protein